MWAERTRKDIGVLMMYDEKYAPVGDISRKNVESYCRKNGYDFIFSYNIKGLITKYGGQNSHMSIRCNELNLPAIIGVGEKIYNNFIDSNKIYIDCKSRPSTRFYSAEITSKRLR